MITLSEIRPVGKFLKPHGVNGEIGILRDFDDFDFNDYSCVIVDIDGIFVRFFLNSVRTKGAETDLVAIDGVTDEMHAARLTNRTVYVLRSEFDRANGADSDGDGYYADDFIGYEMKLEGGRRLGTIVRVDDSTANFLFVVETPEGKEMLIPVVDEFITDISPDDLVLTVDLPQGMLEMQK